jgi:predicted AAA+ superfamily ATPase
MIERQITERVLDALRRQPAVVLVGPRQVGKTTVARSIGDQMGAVYLDCESSRDRAMLADPWLYLSNFRDRLVILDEVHRLPDLFRDLRGIIDEGRRVGNRAGRFLLLGSASLDVVLQSGESLAGRVSYIEMGALTAGEVLGDIATLWLRGGYPESYLAQSDGDSFLWRTDLVRSYLDRDVHAMHPRLPVETMRRLWLMLASNSGGMLNTAVLGRNLETSSVTIGRYLDVLVDLLLVRRLEPFHHSTTKRLVRSPKVYVRDSGLLHALLGIETMEALLGHVMLGQSWEGFVIEQIAQCSPMGSMMNFYRTQAGAEVDCVLTFANGERWVVEIKRSPMAKLHRGAMQAIEDLQPSAVYVVHASHEEIDSAAGHKLISLRGLLRALRGRL